MVSAQCFRNAFIDQWEHDRQHPQTQQALLDAFLSPKWKKRNTYMLDGEDPFLQRVLHRLNLNLATNLSMEKERFKLDAIYYDAENDLFPDWGQIYPTRLEVYIEHETGDYPEEEMYKLLMWPASLKVLIFYDWATFQKEGNQGRQQWLTEKLTKMRTMGRKIDEQRPGVSAAEYLFLIGRTEQQGEPPNWWYLVVQGGCWTGQPDIPQALP